MSLLTRVPLAEEPPPPPPVDVDTSTIEALLPGLGVGAIVAAIIGGCVVLFVERIRQRGENFRKWMDLTRQDERQWNQELRDAFKVVRAQLALLKNTVSNVRLAAHWSGHSFVGDYQKVIEIRNELASVADGLRVFADDSVVQKFTRATSLTDEFLKQFEVSGGEVTYLRETVYETRVPPFQDVEEEILAAVQKALKTPAEWVEPPKGWLRRWMSK